MKMVLWLCMVVVACASMASAVMLDDFESYADDAALNAAWVPTHIYSETLETFNGSTAMLLHIKQADPYWTQTNYSLPDAVPNVHGVNFTYLGYDAIKMDFTIPARNTGGPWDYLDGSGGTFYVSFFDCWGQTVLNAQATSGVTPSGTAMTWEIPFATATVSGMNLENVARIGLGYKSTYYQDGGVFVDNIELVPEPISCVLLAMGALAIRRRR